MHTGKGQLFMWSSTFADMVILGLCWFLCSISIITIGTATSALYYSVAKTIRYGAGKPVQEFFKAFRENQRAGIMTFVPIAITFMTTLILAFLAQTITERIVALLFAGVALGIQIYIYPLISRFELPVVRYFQVAQFCLFHYLSKTICLILVFFLCLLTAVLLPFLVPILVAGYMYYSTFFLEGIFKEYILKTEENKDEWFWN